MTKQRWTTAAMLLLCTGAAGLGFYGVQKHVQHKEIRRACDSVLENPVAREYLRMYEQWSALSPVEQSETPWGQGQYGGPEIQKKLADGRADRLLADLPQLESNTSQYPTELTDVMYGPDWQQKVDKFRHDRAVAELIIIASTFVLACGSIIAIGSSLTNVLKRLYKKLADAKKPQQPGQNAGLENEISDEIERKLIDTQLEVKSTEVEPTDDERETTGEVTESQKQDYFLNRSKNSNKSANQKNLIENKKSSFLDQFTATAKTPSKKEKKKDDYFGWAVEFEEKPELKTLMTTEPLTKELSELTEEVSAIRHFAAQQQDQMRKLQDGYDWMLVRRFCIRIIRCVDNIQDRIDKLEETDDQLCDHLKDVRDELVFALESGGVEQYEPDLNIPYKGLERYAEAIKERIDTNDEAKSGNIAEVIRCGYQYLVNDSDVKIVRCAQVKLYEFKQK